MKHRLYEGWILARDELAPGQRRDLEDHLKECEACNQFAEGDTAVGRAFASVQMSKPMPGFVERWMVGMAERRMRSQRRQTSMILGILSLGVMGLLLPLLFETILVLISPENLLFDLAHSLAEWLSFLSFVAKLFAAFFTTLYSTVPFAFWLMIMVGFVGVGVLWCYSFQRFGGLPSRERSSR